MKYRLIIFALLAMFIGTSCAPSNQVCGNKSQHKKRTAKMKSMAPRMTNR